MTRKIRISNLEDAHGHHGVFVMTEALMMNFTPGTTDTAAVGDTGLSCLHIKPGGFVDIEVQKGDIAGVAGHPNQFSGATELARDMQEIEAFVHTHFSDHPMIAGDEDFPTFEIVNHLLNDLLEVRQTPSKVFVGNFTEEQKEELRKIHPGTVEFQESPARAELLAEQSLAGQQDAKSNAAVDPDAPISDGLTPPPPPEVPEGANPDGEPIVEPETQSPGEPGKDEVPQ